MNIIITNSSGLPIFEQIENAIKEAIFSNELKEGEMLPSVRSLANELKISFLTVKRAYDELEKAEEKIEALKEIYESEKDEELRKIILYQIKEIEDFIYVRDELEKGIND